MSSRFWIERALTILRTEGIRSFLRSLRGYLGNKVWTVRTQLAHMVTPTTGLNAMRDRFGDMKMLYGGENPVIVDGGAYIGQSVSAFRDTFDEPTIHGFEPNPSAYRTLLDRFDQADDISLYECALGAEDADVQFIVNRNRRTSSVLKTGAHADNIFGADVEPTECIQIKQVRLDECLDITPDIIKLDLQGYELEALRGCTELLSDVRLISTEVEFLPLYRSQPLFCDVQSFLESHGFSLYNLYELLTADSGQLIAGDAVFLNTSYYESIGHEPSAVHR